MSSFIKLLINKRMYFIVKYKILIENIASMFGLRSLEYVISILITPYLVRVLEPSGYGSLVYIQGIIQYFIMINRYGFAYSATKKIAEKCEKTNIIVSSVLYAELIVTLFSSIILLFGVFMLWMHEYYLYASLICCMFLSIIGNTFFPIWFFQGIQKMRFITIANLVARIITLLLVFNIVNNNDDIIIAAFLISVSPLIATVIAFYIMYKECGWFLTKVNPKKIMDVFVDGWDYFVSSIASSIYSNSNIVILGLLSTPEMVGIYSGADKIIKSVVGIFSPISQAVFPYMITQYRDNKNKAALFFYKFAKITLICSFIISLMMGFFSKNIVYIFLGEGFKQSVDIMMLLCPIIFMMISSNVLGTLYLIPLGFKKIFSRIIFWGAVIDILIVIPLAHFYDVYGVAFCNLLIESTITISMAVIFLRNKFNYNA